jgi:hypothetical protein
MITGRSLDNFREKGETPPPDWQMFPCEVCGQRVMITPDGARQYAEYKASGSFSRVGIICTPCTMVIGAIGGIDPARTFKSDFVREQEKRDPRIAEQIASAIAGPPFECDTCGRSSAELTVFQYPEFKVETVDNEARPVTIRAEKGAWGACDLCSPAIFASDLEAMVKRAIATNCPERVAREFFGELLKHIDRASAQVRNSRRQQ